MKGKLWRCLLTVLTAMCICFGFAACDEGQPSEKQPLAAPQDVKIEENILSWKAVEGAEKYTVKINDDETTEVSAATLDLTTVTAKLTEGENTLSVKANETKEKAASPYSQAVKYTYAPPPAVHTHTLSKHDAKDATCTEAGNTLYYECSGCGKFFSDDKGEHEVKEDSWVVAAKGHSYGDPEWAWTGDETNGYTTATATFSCENCTDEQVKTATVTHATTTPAACTTTGTETYTATVEFEEETYTDTKTATLAATGHSYGAWAITAPSATDKGKAVKTCANCEEGTEGHTLEKELPVLGDENYQKTADTATCTQTGEVTYTITLDGETFSFEVTTPALNHNWATAWTTENGKHWHACTRCGEKNEEAACEYDKPVFTWTGDGTNGYTATAAFTCKTCSDEQTQPATVESEITKDASCTDKGVKTYTAEVAFGDETYSEEKTEDIPATGHSYGDPTWEWTGSDDDGYTSATATFTCEKCSDTQTRNADAVKTEVEEGCVKKDTYTVTVEFEGEHYSDEPKEVTTAGQHTYNSATWAWAPGDDGGYTATLTLKCGVCQETKELPATVTSSTTQEPSCTAFGEETYTATVQFEGQNYTSTKSVPIFPTPHTYGDDPKWDWTGSDTDGYTAKATFTCTECKTQTLEVDATVSEPDIKNATCTEAGSKTYTATVTVEFGDLTYTDKKIDSIDKTEHQLKKVERIEPTLTTEGQEECWQCETCKQYFSDDKGETPIEKPEVLDKLETTGAANAYVKAVEALDTITEESTKEKADAFATAYEAVEEQYEALDENEQAIHKVVEAKSSSDDKKKAYDDAIEAAEALHTAFKNAVDAATATIEKKESLVTLKANQTTAEAAHTALTTLASGYVTAEETAAYNAIATTIATWEGEIAKEKSALESANIPELKEGDDKTAEEVIVAVDKALKGYDELDGYITSDSDVSTLHDDIAKKKTDAETQIKKTVDALESAATEALSKQGTVKEKYDALLAVKEKQDVLGTYASSLYGEEQKTAIEDALEQIVKEVAETQEYATYLHNDNNNNSYVIIREFVNVLGNAIKFESTPTVTASVSGNTSVNVEVAYDEERGSYVATIPFTRTDDSVDLTYQWDNIDDEKTTVKLGKPQTNFWFALGSVTENRAYKTDGTIAKNEEPTAEHDLYFDLYPDGALEFKDETGENNYGDKNITVKGAPIITRVPVKEVGTLAMLKRYLATHDVLGSMTVVIIAYQAWEEDGVTYYSRTNSASLSDPIELNVIDDDKYIRLNAEWLSPNIQEGGQFELYTPGYIPQINNQINAYSGQTNVTLSTDTAQREGQPTLAEEAMQKYLQARIRAITVDEEGSITVLHEEVVEMKFNGTKLDDFISAWTVAYFKEHLDEYNGTEKFDPQFKNVQYQVCYEPKKEVEESPSPLCDIFRASEWKDVKQDNTETFTVTLKKADVTATNDAMGKINKGMNTYVFFEPGTIGRGEVFTKYYADRVLLDISKTVDGGQTITLHIAFICGDDTTLTLTRVDENGKNEATYADTKYTGTDDLVANRGQNSWCNASVLEGWIKNAFQEELGEETFSISDTGWHYKTKIIVSKKSAENGWFFDGEWSAEFTYDGPVEAV